MFKFRQTHSINSHKAVNNSGFSLTEVIITIAVIGIIAAIALSVYSEYIIKTRVSSAMPSLEDMKIKAGAYYAKHGSFPTSANLGLSGNEWNNDVISSGAFITTARTSCPTGNDLGYIQININSSILETSNNGYLSMVAVDTDGIMSWRCETETSGINAIDAKYLPSGCIVPSC